MKRINNNSQFITAHLRQTLFFVIVVLSVFSFLYILGGDKYVYLRTYPLYSSTTKAYIEKLDFDLLLNNTVKLKYKEKVVLKKFKDLSPVLISNYTKTEVNKDIYHIIHTDGLSFGINKVLLKKNLINNMGLNIKQVQNASYKLRNNYKVDLITEESGMDIQIDDLLSAVSENMFAIKSGAIPTFIIQDFVVEPDITKEDLIKGKIREKLAGIYNLKYGKKTWYFKPVFELNNINYKKEAPNKISINIDEDWFIEYLDQLKPYIEKEVIDVNMYALEDGVNIEGVPEIGIELNGRMLHHQLETAINNGVYFIDIPVIEISPNIEISKDLQSKGIKEIIDIGYTTFTGSPNNRRHNIKTSSDRFRGVLINPDEEFSFNKYLGLVDESTGYKEELVIKPEGLIKEFGGGVCQVSTTIYRAALMTGLDITKRHPHRFAVSYYSQQKGHGLDATIYPPYVDLKFKNNYKHPIVLQTYVNGDYVKAVIYGSKDSRQVELKGPYYSNYKEPSTEVLYVEDVETPPNKPQTVERPQKGFIAKWVREVTNKGDKTSEEIVSIYVPVQKKVSVNSLEEVAGLENELQSSL